MLAFAWEMFIKGKFWRTLSKSCRFNTSSPFTCAAQSHWMLRLPVVPAGTILHVACGVARETERRIGSRITTVHTFALDHAGKERDGCLLGAQRVVNLGDGTGCGECTRLHRHGKTS